MATKKTKKKAEKITTNADKVRNVFFRTYVDPTKALIELGGIAHYAYICHDRDIAENGKSKAPHFHCVVTFTNPRFPSAVEKTIRETIPEEQRNGNELHFEICRGTEGKDASLRYLTHHDHPERAPYELHEVKTDSQEYLRSAYPVEEEEDPNNQIDTNLEFMVNLVDKNAFQMALLYGRDYIKNNARYQDYKGLLECSYINTDHMTLEAKELKKATLTEDEGKRLDIYRAEVRALKLQQSLTELYGLVDHKHIDSYTKEKQEFEKLQDRIDAIASQVDGILTKIDSIRKDK